MPAVFCALLVWALGSLHGSGLPAEPHASVELVADKLSIRPGESFTLALHMKLPAGWHAYYVNPGDAGAPPKISWNLPDGVGVGQIVWPTPGRLTLGGVPANAYTSEVWLPIPVQTAKTLANGQIIRIQAKAEWLLCKDVCVQDSARLELAVRVTTKAEADPFNGPLIAAALATAPQPYIGNGASATMLGRSVRLVLPRMRLREAPRFFGTDPTYFGTEDATFRMADGGLVLLIPLSHSATGTPKRLTGIVAPANGRPFFVDIPISSE